LGSRLYERLLLGITNTEAPVVDVVGDSPDPLLFPVALSGLSESQGPAYPHATGLTAPDLAARCACAEQVFFLGAGSGTEFDGTGVGAGEDALVETVLAHLDPKRCTSVVVLSTAMVYGASRSNPIPISESVPPAVDLAEPVAARLRRERRVSEWGHENGVATAVLRPSLVASAAARSWMDRSVFGARRVLPHERAPIQYVHIDDVVSAMVHAADRQLDGIFNLAPPGWLDEPLLAALSDVRLSARVSLPTLRRWWKFLSIVRPSKVAAGLRPYSIDPWVVSSSALEATGWRATHSNEEAYLVSHRVGWWSAQTARRRQDVALGAAGLSILGGVGALAAAGVRALRSHSRR
jgi:nucleoside-diphosphate-sugar epimerase